MTVAELKAILDTLPDDTEIFVNHERTRLRHPELFYSPHSEMIDAPELNIVPSGTAAHNDAQERAGWRQVNKPRPRLANPE